MEIKKTVLIVDDEQDIRYLLEDCFLQAGFSVEIAATGLHGLQKVSSGKDYDLIITDLKMPKMDGIQFYKKAKEIAPECAFILFTGYPEKNKLIEGFQDGLIHVVLKPAKPSDVLKKAKEIMKEKNEESQLVA